MNENETEQMPQMLSDGIVKYLLDNKPEDVTEENAGEMAVAFLNGVIKEHFRTLSFVRHAEAEGEEDVLASGIATQGSDFTIAVVPTGDDHFVFVIPTTSEEYQGDDIIPIALVGGMDNAVICATVLKSLMDGYEDWKARLDTIMEITDGYEIPES